MLFFLHILLLLLMGMRGTTSFAPYLFLLYSAVLLCHYYVKEGKLELGYYVDRPSEVSMDEPTEKLSWSIIEYYRDDDDEEDCCRNKITTSPPKTDPYPLMRKRRIKLSHSSK